MSLQAVSARTTEGAAPARAHERVLVVDFGAQYTQLIARRVREHHVYSEVVAPVRAAERWQGADLKGVILSGGPASAYAKEAPALSAALLERGVPVLGICYGLQWMAEALGGKVIPSREREFGHTRLRVTQPNPLFEGVDAETIVWMSHGDRVDRLPAGFSRIAATDTCPEAAVMHVSGRLYGVQFHPEVAHTRQGARILENFLRDVCACRGDWLPGDLAEEAIQDIRRQVGGEGEIVLGLSGGVDSAVVGALCQRAVGARCHAIFVDTGLLRAGERDLVEHTFRHHFHLDLTVVDAAERFLRRLQGVTDPEHKRRSIGHEFIDVFREQARRFQRARFLAQGTLYPDVIESVAAHGGPTATIKTHHNVGGLPADLDMELVEPLRMLFKDEVRALGRALGLPEEMVARQPFPGPGLAVRCLGECTPARLEVLRRADRIVREEFEARSEHQGLWQYFAVLLPVRSVGVMGDARTYDEVCAIRCIESQDGMTADWRYPSRELLQAVSSRITNEVRGINRVVLDLTSKPPGTIEWE
ncbi:MAG: glutamine-hydrolyzing GMP synthase [Planctomycetota bacterium]|nr:MAG: glutamine-hydrolyzing GMP synthase [Planctomycetota bacterium]